MDYTATGTAVAAPPPTPDPNTPCTLALYCDLTQSRASVNGLFAPNTPANPSMVWQITVGGVATTIDDDDLVLPKSGNNSAQVKITFNLPAGASFTDMPGLAGPPINGGAPLTSSALRVTVILARNRRKTSTASFSSPFALGSGSAATACAIFDAVVPAATLNASSPPSATLVLGTPTLNSGSQPGNKDSYMSLVAITGFVTQSGGTTLFFTDSHDPEMEIGM